MSEERARYKSDRAGVTVSGSAILRASDEPGTRAFNACEFVVRIPDTYNGEPGHRPIRIIIGSQAAHMRPRPFSVDDVRAALPPLLDELERLEPK